jgi:hypothetical protein
VETKLVGKWLWTGVDAQAVLDFQRDHTLVRERTGFAHHDIQKVPWQTAGNQLTITWPDGEKIVYTVKLTSDVLILSSPVTGSERYSRVK